MKLLTTKETAERLHLHQKTVETYFRTGYIKAFKVGRNWRVPEVELEDFIKQNLFASLTDDFVLRGATQLSPKERETFSVLTHTRLAEVWNHPDEVDYPL
jgi:excisionase family DNA binding protein